MTLAEPVLTISIFSQVIAPMTNTSGAMSIAYSGTVGNEDEMAKRCWRLRPWYRMMISDTAYIHGVAVTKEDGWRRIEQPSVLVTRHRRSRCERAKVRKFGSRMFSTAAQPYWYSFAAPGDRTAERNWSSCKPISRYITRSGLKSW